MNVTLFNQNIGNRSLMIFFKFNDYTKVIDISAENFDSFIIICVLLIWLFVIICYEFYNHNLKKVFKENPLKKAIERGHDITPHLNASNIMTIDPVSGKTMLMFAVNHNLNAETFEKLLNATVEIWPNGLYIKDSYGCDVFTYECCNWDTDFRRIKLLLNSYHTTKPITSEVNSLLYKKAPKEILQLINEKKFRFDVTEVLDNLDDELDDNTDDFTEQFMKFAFDGGFYEQDSDEDTLLHYICRNIKNVNILKFYLSYLSDEIQHNILTGLPLKREHDINVKNIHGRTPLYMAVRYNGSVAFIKLLLEYGADPNCVDLKTLKENISNNSYDCFVMICENFKLKKDLLIN